MHKREVNKTNLNFLVCLFYFFTKVLHLIFQLYFSVTILDNINTGANAHGKEGLRTLLRFVEVLKSRYSPLVFVRPPCTVNHPKPLTS
jgi:hypothetical protein